MKKLFTLFFLFLTSQTFSQTNFRFADSTAQWNELYFQNYFGTPPDLWTIPYSVQKDTIIESRDYQKIFPAGYAGPYFIREDSLKKVFVRRYPDTVDYYIYDFAKNAGDTFYINDAEYRGADFLIRIDSTDSVLLGTKFRKRLYLTLNNWIDDIWIESIGSVYSHIWSPNGQGDALDGQGRNLLCFFENGQRIFHNSRWQDTCSISAETSVLEITENNFTLFPNPATTQLSIQTNGTAIEQINIYNTTGSLVLSALGSTIVNGQLSIAHLPSGVYIADIKTKEGSARKRWVKM